METYLAKWGFFGILSLDDCCERKDVQLDCHKDQKGKAGKHVFDFVCRKRSVAKDLPEKRAFLLGVAEIGREGPPTQIDFDTFLKLKNSPKLHAGNFLSS